jgi:hypothetical protein
MFVTYTPADGDEQRWEFDPGRVRQSEAEIVEKRYGATYDKWRQAIVTGEAKARRVLLWHLLRRDHHTMRYEDTPDFYMDELVVTHSHGELLTLRDRVLKANLPEEEREAVLAALDIEITEAMAGEDEGKATASSAG